MSIASFLVSAVVNQDMTRPEVDFPSVEISVVSFLECCDCW